MIEIKYAILIMVFIFVITIKAEFLNKYEFLKKINNKINSNSFVQVFIFFCIIILTIEKIRYSKFVFIIATIISTIFTLRFVIKIFYLKEFESNKDLLYSNCSILISILVIEYIINSNDIIRNFFQYKTESYVIQIFIFHMIVLILLYVLFMAVIMTIFILWTSYVFSKNFFISKSKKEFIKYIIDMSKKIKSRINSEILEFFNKYFNPMYKIDWIPLYKNISRIRTLILVCYILTGIIIIYYWNDFKYIIEKFEDLNFLSGIMNSINVVTKDFENYRLIFIIPLIGVLTGKLAKKK